MKLQHLTLEKIVDTAFFCGFENMPVSILIAAPPGAGKTWSTAAIKQTESVLYLNKVYSPMEHRKIIGESAPRTRLLINDDLGLMARWNQAEYYSTFCMIIDGEILFRQFKSQNHAKTRCSLILCCTLDYYHANCDNMRAIGLLDRLVPVILDLSAETRKTYQKAVMESNIYEQEPAQRYPAPPDETRVIKAKIIERNDVNPRLIKNLRRMSQFLTEPETEELIALAHGKNTYEV